MVVCHLHLQYSHLHDLECIEEENPHGPHLAPQKTFSVRDVARKAIQVNGSTGENLQLRQQRAADERDRADTKQRIEAERAEAAKHLTLTSLSEQLCKNAGVVPWNKLTKKDVLAKFGLEWTKLDLLAVEFESKPNPQNLRFAPMKLYKAGDVAKALARRQQRAQQLQDRRQASRADALAARRAQAAAAAIEEAGNQ